MKKLPIIFSLCLMYASCLITAGQKQVESYPKDELTLQRIEQLTELQSAEIITENVQISEPLPLTGHTYEDSLNLQYDEKNLILQSVRLDPNKVVTVFPEAVITDEYSNSHVDYISLIPILIGAINEQQKIIKELNNKLERLEGKLNEE